MLHVDVCFGTPPSLRLAEQLDAAIGHVAVHTRRHTRPHVTAYTQLMCRRLWAAATGRPGPACGITRDQTPAAPAPQAAANLRPKSSCACGAAVATRPPPAAKRLISVPQAAPRTSLSSRTRASSNSSGRRTLSTLCERPLYLLVDHGRSRCEPGCRHESLVLVLACSIFVVCANVKVTLRFFQVHASCVSSSLKNAASISERQVGGLPPLQNKLKGCLTRRLSKQPPAGHLAPLPRADAPSRLASRLGCCEWVSSLQRLPWQFSCCHRLWRYLPPP